MVRSRFVVCALTLAVFSVVAAPAGAAFHLWKVKEVFTNANGSVQFIELVNGASTIEHFISGHFIRSTADDVPTTFTIPSNLPNPPNTANRHVLFATPDFAALAGVTPNYTIPANFINPNAVSYTIAFDTLDTNFTFTSSLLPKDGINSITDLNPAGAANLTVGVNSPTNFQGVSGTVPPPPPPNNGDYNGDTFVNAADYTVWRNTLGTDVEQSSGADGNNNGMIDIGDYTFWKNHYGDVVGGAGAGQGVLSLLPEPTTVIMSIVALGFFPLRLVRRTRRAIAK